MSNKSEIVQSQNIDEIQTNHIMDKREEVNKVNSSQKDKQSRCLEPKDVDSVSLRKKRHAVEVEKIRQAIEMKKLENQLKILELENEVRETEIEELQGDRSQDARG
ncbi:uncharacterized protein LOC123672809 [Harmonia axyridis]|uniref:uncharacterized protein LOC123672809 n=1 Tax=Harmonia axyridis TaxID=115357 RepID=UPI001E278377|nr:uncharacterized protein LOC123672809 [Harmonia axyridis]